MPLTQLDTIVALVVIDLQKGVVGLSTLHPVDDRRPNCPLAIAFHEHGLPVVLVDVTGLASGRTDAGSSKFSLPSDWTTLVLELQPHSDDHIVTKQRWGAFLGTSLSVEIDTNEDHESIITRVLHEGYLSEGVTPNHLSQERIVFPESRV